MKLITDLHVHGRESRGCSKDMNIPNFEKYARMKGVDMLGTGDFSHPSWRAHIAENLSEDGSGILRTKSGFPFVLSVEYSFIYSQSGKGRKVHLVVLAPSLEVADQITEHMKKIGRVDYDGRPIFGMNCIDFTEQMMSISRDIEIIPAHIWTPWFSMFGSRSGFDSVDECFGDMVKFIHSIETGMSSDPKMNWRLSQLDRFSILSSSDMHSYWPWRIGREATVFDIKPSYKELIHAIRTGEGIAETIEVDPNYGKYHFDGHRNCGIVFSPEESKKHNNICPVCKKPLTVGVLQRVEELSDRPEGFVPKNRPGFKSLIPLHDILSLMVGKGRATKSVWDEYYRVMKAGKSENDIMLNVSRDDLLHVTNEKIADAIILNRGGRIKIKPGYDGVYGEPILDGLDAPSPKKRGSAGCGSAGKSGQPPDDYEAGPSKSKNPDHNNAQSGLSEFF